MIYLVAALLIVDLGVMVGWIRVNHKELQAHHERHAQRVHQTIQGKCLALQKDAKTSLHRTGDFEQRLDHMLIEVRQAKRFLEESDLNLLRDQIVEAVEKYADLENRCSLALNNTEKLTSDPRVQRAIKSG